MCCQHCLFFIHEQDQCFSELKFCLANRVFTILKPQEPRELPKSAAKIGLIISMLSLCKGHENQDLAFAEHGACFHHEGKWQFLHDLLQNIGLELEVLKWIRTFDSCF